MKIYTRIEMQWDASLQQYVTVSEDSFDCPENGLALCKGASSSENSINQQQQQFQNTLQSDYGQQFANQSNILSSLTNSLSPTVAAGPNQFGYSTAQTNALNSTAIQGTAQAYNNAQKALQNQQAAQGGGNMQLPSGVASQNNATLASQGANQESSQLLGIQNAGYQQGNANYNNAVSALGGVSSQYNPTGYASATTGAGSAAFGGASTIQQQNAASSPWSTIGGLLGGAAGSFLGPLGGSIGKSLGSALGGGGSTSQPAYGSPSAQQTGLAGLDY